MSLSCSQGDRCQLMHGEQVSVQFRTKAAWAANPYGMANKPVELDARHGSQIRQHSTVRCEEYVTGQTGTLDG